MKYIFIENNRSSLPVKKMCQALQVFESGFYRWKKAPVSKREQENNRLKERVKEIYSAHEGMVGSPLVTADLRDEHEFSQVRSKPVAPNLLDRNFKVLAPNIAWVGDSTYIKIGERWHYLTVFIDLFSRAVVSWDLSGSLSSDSTIYALQKAIMRRRPSPGLMVHSDRGIQYASSSFRAILDNHGLIQSMSRKGNCWDNAVAESFFASLKTQLIHHVKYRNRQEAEYSLFNYIEFYFNRQRKHSTNGYKTPALFEQEWWVGEESA